MHLLHQNIYPDCLRIELETIPLSSSSTNREQFDLYLNSKFGTQEKSLLNGRIKFGLRGGRLKLSLNKAKLSLNPDPSDLLQLKNFDSKTPVWIFSRSREQILKGSTIRSKLGTISIRDFPYKIEATITVSPSDVYVIETEGFWRYDLSPNKHGILERKLIFFLESSLKPYLSLGQISDQNSFAENLGTDSQEDSIASSSLLEIIERISQAQTDDFSRLASLANLDLKKDFNGANLRGTELNGIDFSDANLSYSNLRGTNLTDADLSGSNLSYAKLNGADLSGAYLENANLTNADLHRASLALANLIGADLSGANLKEANLSKANLTATSVSATKFSNNEGISNEMKLALLQRGAIFEETEGGRE